MNEPIYMHTLLKYGITATKMQPIHEASTVCIARYCMHIFLCVQANVCADLYTASKSELLTSSYCLQFMQGSA